MSTLTLAQAVAVPTVPKVQPAVWLGCLRCYDSGRLVGRWFPCDGIEDVTLADVHGGAEHVFSDCEEVWCMDSELLPAGTGEMSQAHAAQWGEVYAQVGEAQWSALLAWVNSGCYVADSDGLPVTSEFEDRFCGSWESERVYVDHAAEEVNVWDEIPEHLHSYFDLDKWWRDKRHGYVIEDDGEGGVFVFRSY